MTLGASLARWPWLPAPERFAAKITPSAGDCLLFDGCLDVRGYPTFRDGRMWKAHRWAWVHSNGPIPDGYQIHHVCENKRCVNLAHLRLVTTREHAEIHGAAQRLKRGNGEYNLAKTHCPQGHPYSPENTYVMKGGGRQCRTCNRARAKAYGRAKRQRQ